MSTSPSEPAVNKSSNFKVADYSLDWTVEHATAARSAESTP